ncbi:MAG: beta-propeller fold lactonase family protein [Acidobacteria bacterium]|nr:beta-propeller fold lactonase family protein [Bryobacteraceae bacterium CoA2 C42]
MRRVGGGDAGEGGRPLVAAHQDSDSLMVFRIEGATGKLTPVGRPVPVPVCVKFLAMA